LDDNAAKGEQPSKKMLKNIHSLSYKVEEEWIFSNSCRRKEKKSRRRRHIQRAMKIQRRIIKGRQVMHEKGDEVRLEMN